MIKFVFTGLLGVLALSAFCPADQGAGFAIKEYDGCYSIDTVTASHDYHFIEIKNETKENIWILFERDTAMTNNELIRSRFKTRTYGMSYSEWLFDGNVDWGNPCCGLYSTFFKILPPDQTFTIIQRVGYGQGQDDFKEFARIITTDEMRGLFRSLVQLEPDVKPSYQPNILVID